MLCSQNSGKYLSGAWHENVKLAVQEIDNFTSSDLSFLEMDGTLNGPDGKRNQFDSTMNVGTHPIDPNNYVEEEYDWRENPEVGY